MPKILKILSEFNPIIYKDDNIRMMCPFRERHVGKADGSNSFFLSLDKNVYHCWSCGAKGKASMLLAKRFDVPLFEAIEMVNLLPTLEVYKKDEYELNFVWKIQPPKEFLQRGVKEEILRKHLVGYDDKGHICIPLYDERKKLKGVKFRKGKDFWYDRNFERKNYLYNYNPDYKYAIIVEGEVDVYFVEQWGYNVIGMLGSHLTEEQAEMLSKIPTLYLAQDNDSAGIKGMHKCYQMLRRTNELFFLNYPAKDPAECTRRQFEYSFKNPCNYAEFKLATI